MGGQDGASDADIESPLNEGEKAELVM